MSFKATESDLNDLFSAYGVVQSVDFLKKDDKFTGCVFVQFERKQMAAKALHYLNLSDFLGMFVCFFFDNIANDYSNLLHSTL